MLHTGGAYHLQRYREDVYIEVITSPDDIEGSECAH